MNRIIDTDSYKASQWVQYPPKTETIFSYFESRGTDREWNETVFFGLQYILQEYFSEPITMEEVDEARDVITSHGMPFNYEGWKKLVEKHDGYLPLRIRAVEEGSIVPLKNALLTIENTDPEFYWLTNWFETALSRLWYPVTVATQSYQIRKVILEYLQKTADFPEQEIDFKLHDFGARGVSSHETAQIGGAAHLTSFKGTDTMTALMLLRKHYGADMAGFSIPASEHSTMTSWGRENEVEAYRNMLKQFGGQYPLIACVSDSWDIFNAVKNLWGEELKQEVIESGSMVVVRPDSGNPVEVLMKVFDLLDKKFGSKPNGKGYKVLNNVRVIQGDGVNEETIKEILRVITAMGYSTSNIAFGSGGALLQKLDRDTLKFAYKCSYATIDGKGVEVYKEPVTSKMKVSKKGKLDLVKNENGYETVTLPRGWRDHEISAMDTVYENGKLLRTQTLEEVRNRILDNSN